jgi:transcriptional regulator with XRE-family HTH domain
MSCIRRENEMHIGERIKSRREELGLTQAQLAKKAGIGQPYISKIENKTMESPSMTALESLANALSIDILKLIEDTSYSLSRWSDYAKGTLIGYCPNLQCPGSNFADMQRDGEVNLSEWEPYKTSLFDEDKEPINYCVHCGTQLVTDCRHCGRKIKQRHRYCPGCGKEFFVLDPDDVPF